MTVAVTRLRQPLLVQDAALAILVTCFQLLGTLRAAANQPGARPLAEPGDLGCLLLTATGMVLLGQRYRSAAVFATAAGLSLAYYAAGYPDGPGTLGLLVATYTLARGGRRQPVAPDRRGQHRRSFRVALLELWPGARSCAAQCRIVSGSPRRSAHRSGPYARVRPDPGPAARATADGRRTGPAGAAQGGPGLRGGLAVLLGD